jgi:hypothetical protein
MSVVVPTHERRRDVLRCLEPVLADPATWEVVVVVDGSNDGTAGAIRERFGDDSRLQVLETPCRGQEMAQRTGAGLTRGDAILFLDDDVEIADGTVTGHARHHERDDADVVVGYMPCELRGLPPPSLWPVLHYSGQYERKVALWERDPGRVLAHLWGGNVSVGAAAWRLLPQYPGPRPLSYHMDWELGLRCQWAGLRAVFDCGLRATHHQRRDLEGFLRDRRRSAADRLEVHAVYRSRLGPLPLTHFCQDCSMLTRWVIGTRWMPAALALRGAWAVQLCVASALGARRWERRCALDLTSVEGAVALIRAERDCGARSGC